MKLYLSVCFLFIGYFLHGQSADQEFLIDSLYSKNDDVAPVLSPDGNKLYFTKSYHPQNTAGLKDAGDIWVSEKIDGIWRSPFHLNEPFNNQRFNLMVGFADKGKTAYFLGDYQNDGEITLYYSLKTKAAWSKPSKVIIPYFKNQSDHISGTLSMDGEILVLSLKSYASRGNEDIYVAFRKSINEFTELTNLGSDINTYAQELTPFLAPDGETLFFSSNGYSGAGSKDIFFSKRLNNAWDKWSEPVNFSLINTKGADWYPFITNHGAIYYVNVVNSLGKGNLMVRSETNLDQIMSPLVKNERELVSNVNDRILPAVERNKKSDALKIRISTVEQEERTAVSATTRIYELNPITKDQSIIEVIEGRQDFYFEGLTDRVYTLEVDAKGYFSEKITFKTDTIAALSIEIPLKSIKEGITVQLEDVLFKRGTAELIRSSYSELETVLNFLKENETVSILIAGHTDNRGSPKLNVELSQSRANTVKDYLVKNGIGEDRLESKGFGGVNPIASNASEKTRKLNRRVEFTIRKIK